METPFNPFILDLKGLVMNAYHTEMSLEPIQGSIKEKINPASKGFSNFVLKFFEPTMAIAKSPVNLIAVVDGGNQLRAANYAGYKASRKRSEDQQDPVEKEQLDVTMDLVKRFLAALGIPLVTLKHQEADDVIAYMCSRLHGQKTIVTIDKDLIALAKDDVGIFRNCELISEYVNGDIVVPPNLIPLYLSILGDASDDLPGVKGMGPAAWRKLQSDFGTDGLEQLLDLVASDSRHQFLAVAQVAKSKELDKLASNWHEWRKQFWLVSLHPEICDKAGASLEWYKRVPTMDRLHKVLDDAGALDLFEQYSEYCYTQTLVTEGNVHECLEVMQRLAKETPIVAFDYETYDPVKNPNYIKAADGKQYIDVLNSKITGCSFSVGRNMNHVFYLSVYHANTSNISQDYIKDFLQYLEDQDIPYIAQNSAFEGVISKKELGYTLCGWYDTAVYAHHLNENEEIGLKYLSKRHLNYTQATYGETIAAAGVEDMSQISGDQVLSYGCDDAVVTAHLAHLFFLRTQLEGTYEFITTYDCPSNQAFAEAFMHGVKLDADEIDRQKGEDAQTMAETLEEIRRLLLEHCTNPNFPAVEAFYADQLSYVNSKAADKLEAGATFADKTNQQRQATSEYRQKLKDNCRYVPLREARHPEQFIPTPAKLTKVANYLGLPAIEKVTKAYLSDYLADNKGVGNDEFLGLLATGIPFFKAREGEGYYPLKEFCDKVLYDIAPIVMEGTELNFGSPNQMQYLLYLLLGLPIRIRTKVTRGSLRHRYKLPGSPSTNNKAIAFALANDCEGEDAWKAEVLKALNKHSKASKRMSAYWNKYPLWMDGDGMIHPNFRNPGTVTRRPSSSMPNVLQVSKGPVRDCYIPRKKGNVIVSVDFASQELAVMAACTGDENFLSAYMGEKRKDLHTMTACAIVPSLLPMLDNIQASDIAILSNNFVDYSWYMDHKDDDTDVGRLLTYARNKIAKVVNFAVCYGAVAVSISQQAMVKLSIAEAALDGMMTMYPGIPVWKERVLAQAAIDGYVTTTYGSRRHCGNALRTGEYAQVGRWERQLCNFKIQGQCADLLKVVLTNLCKTKLYERHAAYLIAPVYDELLSEVPMERLYEFLHELADIMEVYMPGICVKMVADCSFGPTWGTQYEIGARPTRELIEQKLSEMLAAVDPQPDIPEDLIEYSVDYEEVEEELDDDIELLEME